jgi:phosphatidate cytidylyltransferase
VLKQRLVSGTILALAAVGILYGDSFLAPYYPILLAFTLLLGVLGTKELIGLTGEVGRPWFAVSAFGVVAVLVSNWVPVVWPNIHPGSAVACAFVAVVIGIFLVEMASFRQPGGIVVRLAQTVFIVAYLGLLAGCFVRIRFLPGEHSALLLLLTIFVTKCGDIGAYATGMLIGKHKFTPLLSPKKTWEGFFGGQLASVLTAVGLSFAGPVFPHGMIEAVGFGIVVGLAGVFGDLAESLIKRDVGLKDAARSIPGMGGVLDVIDSILFAAPVALVWFHNH